MILKSLGMSVRNADGTSEHLPPPDTCFQKITIADICPSYLP